MALIDFPPPLGVNVIRYSFTSQPLGGGTTSTMILSGGVGRSLIIPGVSWQSASVVKLKTFSGPTLPLLFIFTFAEHVVPAGRRGKRIDVDGYDNGKFLAPEADSAPFTQLILKST